MDGNGRAREKTGRAGIGMLVGAVALFAWLAGELLVRSFGGGTSGGGFERLATIALLLNAALVLIAWRHVRRRTAGMPGRAPDEERTADRDPLTGLLTRQGLMERDRTLGAMASARRKALALVVIDVDQLKAVNDLHGHAVGDALLRSLATGVVNAVPGAAAVARVDGDEFAVAIEHDPARPADVEGMAHLLVGKLGQPHSVDGIALRITCSIGIARDDGHGVALGTLLRQADLAMEAAKRSGGDRHLWFDASVEDDHDERDAIEAGLRVALGEDRVVPFFEPQVDLSTGRLVGFEVLARWLDPERGVVPPGAFLAVAERSGLTDRMSLTLMRQAFVAARDWDPAITLAVNLAPSQLRDVWLAQKIMRVMTETGFPPGRLEIEVTEEGLIDNVPLAQSIVDSLRNQGARLVLDDFGTGYSSLAHLRALPFDRVKIDRSFVQSAITRPDSAAVVNAILRLGDSLNLPVTAEGVETVDIAERMAAWGCARGQGWAFGRALPAAGAHRLLAERGMLRGTGAGEAFTSRRRAS